MKKPIKLLVFKLLFLCVVLSTANALQTDAVLDSANTCYINNDYAGAAELYLSLVEEGYSSPGLFYNLGNALYKQNNTAMAILYYEKAQKLAPYDEDIANNLEMAYLRTADKIPDIPEFFIIEWYKSVYNLLSPDLWALLSIVFLTAALLLIFLNIKYNKKLIKRYSVSAGVILVISALIFFTFSISRKKFIESGNTAIITAISVEVKSSPENQGTNLFILHAGTRVSILDKLDNWNEIRIGNGNVGWVPASAMAVI